MEFKSLIKEDQIHLRIERLSKKLLRSKTDKENLETLGYQLSAIQKEKLFLRQQFASFKHSQKIEQTTEVTVFKDILNSLRLSNNQKSKKALQISNQKHNPQLPTIQTYSKSFKNLSATNSSNEQSLAALDKLIEIEETIHENLQFVNERLLADLKILRQKIDRFNSYKFHIDRNLSKISQSNIQVKFKKVR